MKSAVYNAGRTPPQPGRATGDGRAGRVAVPDGGNTEEEDELGGEASVAGAAAGVREDLSAEVGGEEVAESEQERPGAMQSAT